MNPTIAIGQTVVVALPDGRHFGRVVGREDGTLNHWLANEPHLVVRIGDEWRAVPESRCRPLHECAQHATKTRPVVTPDGL